MPDNTFKPNSVWGYCRVSTDMQNYERQKLLIHEYANTHRWRVDRFLECKVSSRRGEAERGLDILRHAAENGTVDTVVFAELSRLGRSVGEICRIIEHLVETCGVSLHFVKESFVLHKGQHDMATKVMLTMFSLLAEIERDLISERTKSALAACKARGVRLGRPPEKSKLDKDEAQIREWSNLGVTQRAMAKHLACTEATLSNWLKRKRSEWLIEGGSDEV